VTATTHIERRLPQFQPAVSFRVVTKWLFVQETLACKIR